MRLDRQLLWRFGPFSPIILLCYHLHWGAGVDCDIIARTNVAVSLFAPFVMTLSRRP